MEEEHIRCVLSIDRRNLYFVNIFLKKVNKLKRGKVACLIAWFYGMSTLNGLFNAKVIFTNIYMVTISEPFLHQIIIKTNSSYTIFAIVGSVYVNEPGDQGSIPDRVIPKTQKMVPDATLLNAQHNKVRIKDKVEQSRERSSALSNTLVL